MDADNAGCRETSVRIATTAGIIAAALLVFLTLMNSA